MNANPSKLLRIVAALAALGFLVVAPAAARASAGGLAEAGVGLAVPVADSSYRHDFDPSPSLWLAGVYLPPLDNRFLGIEMGFEYTPYKDEFVARNGASTDFTRVRLELGARYLRSLTPDLTGFARALAGVDMISWTQTGKIGPVPYNDDDTHLGLALELGAGVLYRLGPITVGAQLALPVGIHHQTVYDGGVAIDRDAFDVELRLTVGNDY
jgi:hypothetical protein